MTKLELLKSELLQEIENAGKRYGTYEDVTLIENAYQAGIPDEPRTWCALGYRLSDDNNVSIHAPRAGGDIWQFASRISIFQDLKKIFKFLTSVIYIMYIFAFCHCLASLINFHLGVVNYLLLFLFQKILH